MIYRSKTLIKRMLSAHKWFGLAFGAVLYLLCLTGALLVFSGEIERWEHAGVPEFKALNVDALERAYQQTLARAEEPPKTLWLVLPTESLPRAHVSLGEEEWYTDEQGNLLDSPSVQWKDMLTHLHYYLHLPETFGMIVVGIFGVVLLALSISGVFSHPTIIKDAFKFRSGKSFRLMQTDLHNRIGVWGLPFNIMIALTGAFIGLLSILVLVLAPLFYGGDRQAVSDAVYGADIEVSEQAENFDIANALNQLKVVAPNATPIYFSFQKPGTSEQFVEIAATLPGRLIYSEIYRFDAEGRYINHQGMSDGPVARQVAYSVYRLHFGAFGGYAIKFLYFICGIALCLLCVSGLTIWFEKQKHQTRLNQMWGATVWGVPISLFVSAWFCLLAINMPVSASQIFWGSFLSLLVCSVALPRYWMSRRALKKGLGILLLILGGTHIALFLHAQTALTYVVNGVFIVTGIGFLVPQLFRK